jgi:hypothetical protein
MTINYDSLVAYINSLNSDGTLTKADLNRIIQYILSGGLTDTINTQKSNNGGIF